jgi:phage-related protein
MPKLPQKYQVLPLPIVEKTARKILSDEQRRAAINIAEQLEDFPNVQHLDLDKCGEGIRVAFRSPEINKHGWLRGIFWIDDKERIIYFVDLFWKKTNKIALADVTRANHRIRRLRAELAKGIRPWSKAA